METLVTDSAVAYRRLLAPDTSEINCNLSFVNSERPPKLNERVKIHSYETRHAKLWILKYKPASHC